MSNPKNIKLNNLIKGIIRDSGVAPIYNCTLSINDPNNNFYYKKSVGVRDESGATIHHNDAFRIGSITKTFTAVIIFQLIEEGFLQLDDKFLDRVTEPTKELLKDLIVFEGVNYSNAITIKNLLQHRSGLRDYFADDERFLATLRAFPNQEWNWRKVMEKYKEYELPQKALSKPNEGYYYSDTNYLLLAVLAEELTHESFHNLLEKRILLPLNLQNTYLEYHQKSKNNTPVTYPYHSIHHLKNINTSFDWGAGGLIANADDLAIFIRALVEGQLFQKVETLQKILTFEESSPPKVPAKRETIYGMGLIKKKIAGHELIGHTSAYGAMMFYEPLYDRSIVISLNQALGVHKAEWLLNKVLEELEV
ncbi:MAG: serine hydrolase domain-containing protein [Flavobacteriaceae bacterium]|nr:serine hydrolase domain-containing protein [Flavobacteriaceae bacterium]